MNSKIESSALWGACARLLLALAASLGCAAIDVRSQSAPGGWNAGASKIAITPAEPIRMAGFEFRTHPSDSIRQDIHVKALALQDETGKISVLVTADLADIRRDVWDAVAERCEKQFGLTRDRLILNESHSHSGPIVTLGPIPPAYELTPAEDAVVRRYSSGFVDRSVDAVGQAIQRLAPATLAFQHGLAGIAVNRRRTPIFCGVPGGPVDPDVPVLCVRDAHGNFLAIATGYACHPTVFLDDQISGDWPGYAQEEIEKAHPGAVALFVQGCGGDSFAVPRQSVELARIYGGRFAAAVEQVLSSEMAPLSGPIRTAFERVDIPFQAPPSRQQLLKARADADPIVRRHAERLLQQLDRDGKLIDRYPYPVQVWRFGRNLTLIALGGEAVVDYSRRLKTELGWDSTWVAAYSNDNFAYIPSLRVLKEGGYEGVDAMADTDLPGPFGAAVEEIIVEKVNDLVRQVSK